MATHKHNCQHRSIYLTYIFIHRQFATVSVSAKSLSNTFNCGCNFAWIFVSTFNRKFCTIIFALWRRWVTLAIYNLEQNAQFFIKLTNAHPPFKEWTINVLYVKTVRRQHIVYPVVKLSKQYMVCSCNVTFPTLPPIERFIRAWLYIMPHSIINSYIMHGLYRTGEFGLCCLVHKTCFISS